MAGWSHWYNYLYRYVVGKAGKMICQKQGMHVENLIFTGIVISGLVCFLWMAPGRSPGQDD